MNIESNLNPRNYNEHEVCRIVNPKQNILYIKNRVYPIDMYPSIDKAGNDVIVFIYLKSETKEVYQKWLNYELE